MNEFLEQFVIESREAVEQATDDLLFLEQAPDDRERLDSAFRRFHTLKGGAGIVEFPAMVRVMHVAEDILSAVRAGDFPLTTDVISNCLSCLDQVLVWLDAMEAEGDLPGDVDAAAASLVAKFAPLGLPAVAAMPTPTPDPTDGAWIGPLLAKYSGPVAARTAFRYAPDANCFFRGEDPLALMETLPGLLVLDARPREPWPPLDELDPFVCNLVIEALTSLSQDEAADHVRSVRAQVEIVALSERDPAGAARLSDRATAVLREQILLASGPRGKDFAGRLGSAGRVAGNVLRYLGFGGEAAALDAALARSEAAAGPGEFIAALEAILKGPPNSGPRDGTAHPGAAVAEPGGPVARALRVDVERVDAVVKLTGELTVVKNALGHAVRLAREGGDPAALAQTLKQHHAQLERLTENLQRSVLAIRVLPLQQIFRRFPRLVREMAAGLGKSARLATEGEATEADKAVIEALFEPLLHVLRNAVDHGVETAAQRHAAGKPDMAVIHLRGRRQAEHVIVEIEDDGRGIDPAEVRRVAAARGLVPAETLAAMNDDEIVDLIFVPGFSTAGAVTDISGRGVGMDAVRTAIERLGGRVKVRGRVGRGTTVQFTLPFTVMVTQVMTVEAAGQQFGVPFEAVVETLQLPRDRIVPIGAAAAFVLRGRTVPLLTLARALDLGQDRPTSPIVNAVVTEVGGQLSALEVDRFGERLDVMLKPMDGLLAGMRGVAGTTLLGDGQVLIVLDLDELLR